MPLLIVTYAVQIATLFYAAVHQDVAPGPTGMLPVPLNGGVSLNGNAITATFLACGMLQSFALWSLSRSTIAPRWIAAGAIALAALSICAPAMISADAYAYVSDALLGLQAYAPPAVAYAGDLSPIARWWSTPMPATPYGPLWIAAAWGATSAFPTLLGKVIALRVLGAACIAAIVVILRASGLPVRIVALAALNPALYLQFVASAHNDALGIALVLAGGLYVRSRPVVAVALVAAGGLVKLPFVIFAAPLFARAGSLGVRIAFLAAAAVIAAAVSLAAGGAAFVRAQTPHVASTGVAAITTILVVLAAFAALATALAGRRRLRSAVWLMPLVSAYTCAWYLLWALPYAVARRRIAAYLLIAYPLVSVLLEVKFHAAVDAVRGGSAGRCRASARVAKTMNDAVLAIFLVPYAAAAIFVIADLRGSFARSHVPTPPLSGALWVLAGTLLYAAQLGLSWWAATHQADPRFSYRLLPLPVVDLTGTPHDLLSVAVVAIGAAQSYVLLGLYRSNPSHRVLVAGFAALAAMSLSSPSFASFDPYGYVHNSLLGRLAYAPPAAPFAGEYHVIDSGFTDRLPRSTDRCGFRSCR